MASGSSLSPVLRYVDGKVMSNWMCTWNFKPFFLKKSHLCVEGNGGKSACLVSNKILLQRLSILKQS